jgi:integrase
MTKRRGFRDGGIDQRGENSWRLRYRIDGKRYSRAFRGTRPEAQRALRDLLHAGDKGEHVAPSKVTVGRWVDEWLEIGAPGRRRKKVSQRTLERYGQLLRTHVKPALGETPLQRLGAPDIDRLYTLIEAAGKIAPRTAHHVHTVFGACLATAHRKGMIANNPMVRVERIPNAVAELIEDQGSDDDIGEGLEEAELARLIAGFERSTLYPIVALAAVTGARRNEILALRWSDLDVEKMTLRIERAWEQTEKYGLRLKPPKTKRGLRTIDLDDATVNMLLEEKSRHQRIAAGVPDGTTVDLSLIKLPAGALMFPAMPEGGQSFDFASPRNPRNFSKEFARRADLLNFGRTRFHDLRGVHATALLDANIPVHTVAQRIGDDPAVLLRNYAKRKRSIKASQSLATAIATFASGFLGK